MPLQIIFWHFLFLSFFSTIVSRDSTMDNVNKMIQAINESRSKNLTNLREIFDNADTTLDQWGSLANEIGVTIRNFVKEKYSSDSGEFAAIKTLGNLSLSIFQSKPQEMNPDRLEVNFLRFDQKYHTIMTVHLNDLENMIKFVSGEFITDRFYSETCKDFHNPLEIIDGIHSLMVKNCQKDSKIQNEIIFAIKIYFRVKGFFDELEQNEPGLTVLFFKNYKKRIMMALSLKSEKFAKNILQNLKRDVKNKGIQEIWDILGKLSNDLTDVSFGQEDFRCLPQEIIRLPNFYFVSDTFAQIIKELLDVSIAAIFCVDEISDGYPQVRDKMVKKMQRQLGEIFEYSKIFVKMLLNDFLVYEALTEILRELLSHRFEKSMIPSDSYNKTAADIQQYLNSRGQEIIFFQVVIVPSIIYGKETEMFSFSNISKTAYFILNSKNCHVFVTRYNVTDETINERAKQAQKFVTENEEKISNVIKENYDETNMLDLYLKIEEVVPEIISDKYYTSLLIFKGCDDLQYGIAGTTVTESISYFSTIYVETSSWIKTYCHRLFFFLE